MDIAKDARMTLEQLGELGEALLVVSARSSCLKERKDLRSLMEENLATDEVKMDFAQKCTMLTSKQDPAAPKDPLAKKIRAMLTKIDKQLSAYDAKVGSSLQLIQLDPQGIYICKQKTCYLCSQRSYRGSGSRGGIEGHQTCTTPGSCSSSS